jgi:MoxR-like ATPase
MALQGHAFTSVADVGERLRAVGYLADDAIATTVFLADRLRKPLLVEGPAGVGKTELAKALAAIVEADLVRLQCYEGLDESRALYEWNYKKQLLRIQAASTGSAPGIPSAGIPSAGIPSAGIPSTGIPSAGGGGAAPAGDGGERDGWRRTHDDIFSEEFLLARPLLTAIRREGPTVLLVDETDKADVEVEGLLLEVLSDFQITIPELGTVKAVRRPFVVLTSNASRELSEALKRRCLYLYLDYPSAAREKDIVLARVPDLPERLAESLVRTVRALRAMELKKAPSIAETIDWAHTVLALGFDTFDEGAVASTLGVVLKHAGDQARAISQLKLAAN